MADPIDIGLGDQPSPLRADYRTLGSTGLAQSGGYLQPKPWDRNLFGAQAARIFQEMADTDPSAGSIVHLNGSVIRSVDWLMREHSESPEDIAAARFVETCMEDMDQPFETVISIIVESIFVQGHSLHELCYKKREGNDPTIEGHPPSKYNDGKIGWMGLPQRAAETLTRWEFSDSSGHVTGVWQLAPPDFQLTYIPESKFANFVANVGGDGSPTGKSMLRRGVRPYQRKRQMENIEAIATEREGCGIPVMWVPPELLNTNRAADPTGSLAARRDELKRIVTNLRTDEQAGLLLPLSYSADGSKQYELQLLSSSGTRSIDVGAVIVRYENQIFRTILADFLTVGSAGSGSFALVSSRTQLFLLSLKLYLETITETFNRVIIPRLLRLNGFQLEGFPTLAHTPLEQVDGQQLCASIQALAASGANIWPNDDILRRVLEVLGLPAPTNDAGGAQPQLAGISDEALPEEVLPGDTLDENGQVQRPTTQPGERPGPAGAVDRDAEAARPERRPFNRFGGRR